MLMRCGGGRTWVRTGGGGVRGEVGGDPPRVAPPPPPPTLPPAPETGPPPRPPPPPRPVHCPLRGRRSPCALLLPVLSLRADAAANAACLLRHKEYIATYLIDRRAARLIDRPSLDLPGRGRAS